MKWSAHTRRIASFIAVGSTAAAVHFGVVVALVSAFDVAPLSANVAGWLIAFSVSFTGHLNLSFRDEQAPPLRAGLRFFAISAAGFLANEAMYAVLLHWSGLSYAVALAVVLIVIALITYLASRHWAFLGSAVR